jgi:DNA-binding IclR family transcriptional regulator
MPVQAIEQESRASTSSADPSHVRVGSSHMPNIRDAPDPHLSRSLEYGLAMLECFPSESPALGIAEMADMLGMSRSTTHRYAMTLVTLGYLEQDSKRRYRLAREAAGPGAAAIGAIRRLLPARAALEELRGQAGHTVSVGVLDGTRVTYVHRLRGHRAGQYAVDQDFGVGAHVPVHCTALGKILLASLSDPERHKLLTNIELERYTPSTITSKSQLVAELDQIDAREVVISDEEHIRGSRSIATIIPRPASESPVAIDITVPAHAYTPEQLAESLGEPLKQTARLISG